MVHTLGCLAALRDADPGDAVDRVLRRLTEPDIGVAVQRRSSGERWETIVVELPEGGTPSLEVHQYDSTVDLMTTEAERHDVDVSFMPDSFVEWYPHTSGTGLAQVALAAAINGAEHVLWDSTEGFLVDHADQDPADPLSPPG